MVGVHATVAYQFALIKLSLYGLLSQLVSYDEEARKLFWLLQLSHLNNLKGPRRKKYQVVQIKKCTISASCDSFDLNPPQVENHWFR